MSGKPTYEELKKRIQALEQAERKHTQAEEELVQIFSMSIDMICIADINTATFIKVNPAFTEILGHSEESLLNKPFLDFVHPDDMDATKTVIEQKLQSGVKVINFENRYRCKNGSYRWLSWVTRPNPERGVAYAVARDITEWKKDKESLKKSKDLFDATGRMAKIGGWEVDVHTMDLSWTDETYRIHKVPVGYTPCLEDAIKFFHPEDRPQLELAIQRSLNRGEPYDMEVRFITADGKQLWTRTKCQPEIINGEIVKLKGIFQDITDRKQAEEALQSSRKRLKSIIDAAPFGAHIYHLKDHSELIFSGYNLAAENIIGVEHEQFIDKPIEEAFPNLADTPIPQAYRHVAESGEPYYSEQVDYDEQGIKGAFEVSAVKIGKNQMVAFFRDVTERKKAEEKLKESEAKFRELADMLPQIVFETDAKAKLTFANQNAFDIFGYTKEDFERGLSAIQMIAPKDREHAADRMLQIMTGQSNLSGYEYTAIKKDGTEFPAVIYSRRFLSDGKLAGLRGIMIDITDRKRVEEALKESKTFLENMSDVAYTADDQGNVVWVNPAAERVTGVPLEDIIGKSFMPLFVEADHASLMDVYKRTLAGESLENTLTFKSGVTCHFSSLPKRNSQGEIIGTFGVARDISDRLAAERALQTSEARLKKAQAMAKVGNWEYDIATGKVWGSEEAFRIYGLERTSEFLPLDEVESYITDARRVNQALVDLIKHNSVYDIEFQINSKKREGLTHIHSMADLVHDGDGKPVKVVGVIQDITETKRAEKEREELEGKLRQAQKMEAIGRLAGGVAHDFNNMLSVIIGHADMAIKEVDPSQPIYERLEEIRKAGERSSDLTRQLLAFARKQTVSPEVLDLNTTVGSMTRMLQRLIGEGIDLLWRPCKAVSPVKMDPSQIDQILANLCVNARDAIADVGKVTIETGNVAFDEAYCSDHPGFFPGEYVLLSVSDNGCGIDEETLENIFEPFFTTKKAGQGTGLGLATVYGIVKQNGGFINVYSELNQGTTFKIHLPRHRAKSDRLSDKIKDRLTERGQETILLVEDEIAILRLTRQMLERLGYQVVTARTPGEAIRLAQEHTGEIHLLVTDVVMPEMNGRNLAKNILSIHPNIKRLFMSGYTANVIAHHGVLDEGVNFIQKPFSMEQLGAKVREALDEDAL